MMNFGRQRSPRQALVVISCLALSGCAGHLLAEGKKETAIAVNACRAQWPVITRENVVARAQCVGEAEETILAPAAGDYGDLIMQGVAFRNAMAARVATGELSPEDYQLKVAEFRSHLQDEANSRQAQYAAIGAQRLQAFANAMAASAAVAQASRPVYVAPPPTLSQTLHTNCFTMGGATNCTTQ